nr:MAG TPA: hypothetical protein [Caudoviricetes sp.]
MRLYKPINSKNSSIIFILVIIRGIINYYLMQNV